MAPRLRRVDLASSGLEVAPRLVGAILAVLDPASGVLRVRIVETEAYLPDDPASHAFGGPTPRNRSMFERAGTLYVYRAYGVHLCANVVTDAAGVGSAVLIRAAEPLEGLATLRAHRPEVPDGDLCRGPGRLTRALGLEPGDDGEDLIAGRRVWLERGRMPDAVVRGPRVGITRATAVEWRFAEAGSGSVSSPRPAMDRGSRRR